MGKMKAVVLETYLVGVERPCYPETEDFITVTDDYDGFGPDLLATYPLEKVDAETAEQAAWDYACRHALFPIQAVVNLSDRYGEWMLDEDGMHEV
jgi:hypothetical protein